MKNKIEIFGTEGKSVCCYDWKSSEDNSTNISYLSSNGDDILEKEEFSEDSEE